jgi:hypothetical protein
LKIIYKVRGFLEIKEYISGTMKPFNERAERSGFQEDGRATEAMTGGPVFFWSRQEN